MFTSSVPSLCLRCAFAVPSLHRSCTFSVPSLYLYCSLAAPYLYLRCAFALRSPYFHSYVRRTFPVPPLYLFCSHGAVKVAVTDVYDCLVEGTPEAYCMYMDNWSQGEDLSFETYRFENETV